MKYDITRHSDPEYFEIRTKGHAEVSAFNSVLDAIFNHPQWTPGGSVLLDHSELILSFFRTDDVRSISRLVIQNREKIGEGKWAFIISGNFAYGMARMWQIITEEHTPMEINIFKNRVKALEWLFADRENEKKLVQ